MVYCPGTAIQRKLSCLIWCLCKSLFIELGIQIKSCHPTSLGMKKIIVLESCIKKWIDILFTLHYFVGGSENSDRRQKSNVQYCLFLSASQKTGQAVSFFPTIKQILIPILVREILMGWYFMAKMDSLTADMS